jgi:multidrug resistance efflux pump
MKRIIVIVVVVAILAVAGFFGYQQFMAPAAATPTPTVEVKSSGKSSSSAIVSAEGFVMPIHKTDLAFQAGGPVTEVLVAEGDHVEAKQVLARLNSIDQQMAVAQAEASVKQAQVGVESAKAAVASAQAQLAQAKAGPRPETIAQAEAAVQTAQAQLAQLVAGARREDIDAASTSLLKAAAALRLAQAEYDKISWAGDVGQLPQSLALEQATMDYQAAKAQYEKLKNGPTAQEIAVARAGVAEAKAALVAAQAGPTQEVIAVAEAGVKEAEVGVTQAEAALAIAQAALTTAQTALSHFELTAPMAGTVGQVNLDVGQFVSPGTPVISLEDTSQWTVETDDLSEVDIVPVALGQPVKVTVDALPDKEFNGVVSAITPRSETKRGDVTYTVTVDLTDAADAPLRWGMTAFVDISVK